ncbi:MAG TPA: response regulator transcription factor [Alphaproteobacteria bacterium]|nr:response regulator transcription factor [Alphaproteobacteria bacterium]
MSKIRVLLVDDNDLLTMAMQETVDLEDDMECVGCLDRADTLPETVAEKTPQVVLLDLQMPGRDSLTAMQEVVAAKPEVRFIVCSGYADGELVDRAVSLGAWGFVMKNGDIDAMLNAIRRVAAGEMSLPG